MECFPPSPPSSPPSQLVSWSFVLLLLVTIKNKRLLPLLCCFKFNIYLNYISRKSIVTDFFFFAFRHKQELRPK